MTVTRRTPLQSQLQKPSKQAEQKEQISLPKEKLVPSDNINDYHRIIYGVPGIGKSTLLEMFPKALFFFFDPLDPSLSVYGRQIQKWPSFKAYISKLEQGGHDYTDIVIDRIDTCYEMCLRYVCDQNGWKHPTDEREWGKGWDAVKQELNPSLNRLMRLGLGVTYISHERTVKVELRKGNKYDRVEPTYSGQIAKVLDGPVSVVARYYYDGPDRWLQIQGDDFVIAKCRTNEDHPHFLTPDGKHIRRVPMGNTKREAYRNFLAAFNNQQIFTGEEEDEEIKEIENRPKKVLTRRVRP